MKLFFHEIIHFATSLMVTRLVNFFFGNLLFACIGAFLGGFFIDVDHLIDYYIAFGTRLHLPTFFKGTHFKKNNKVFVLLHGWEYVLVLLVISLFVNNSQLFVFLLSLALGTFVHLVVDASTNNVKIKGYSILYRIKHNFKNSSISKYKI